MRISVRVKLGLTLFLAVATFLGIDHFLRNMAFRGAFSQLDIEHADLDIAEARNVLRDLVHEMSQTASQMDATAIAAGESFEADRADLALLIDRNGKVLARRITEPAGTPLGDLREVPSEQLAPNHPLRFSWRQRNVPEGFLETKYGFFAVGSAEFRVSSEPTLMIFGRLLTKTRLAELAATSGSTFELASMHGFDPEARIPAELLDSIGTGETIILESEGENGTAYAALEDLRGLPTLALKAQLEEPVWNDLERYEMLTAAGVALIFPLVLLVLLQIVVTGPLARLTSLASEIGASDDPTLRVCMDRRDEIGTLSETFDAMLDEIERSRTAQARTARVAGRSEIAVGVMHNVGNLINSIHVSASLARDRAAACDCRDLRTILETLRSNEGDLDRYLAEDERGRHLLSFFEAILPPLETAAESTLKETEVVLENVDQISRLVHSLQSAESREEVIDRVEVTREIDSAIEMALEDDVASESIHIERDFDGPHQASVDRQRMYEVLLALLLNAREALPDGPSATRAIRVKSTLMDSGNIQICVSDSGQGVPENKRREIFEMGYTTKEAGSGLGLHLASLAATELGGGLTVEQDSTLPGATFAFEFPLQREAEPRSLISRAREEEDSMASPMAEEAAVKPAAESSPPAH